MFYTIRNQLYFIFSNQLFDIIYFFGYRTFTVDSICFRHDLINVYSLLYVVCKTSNNGDNILDFFFIYAQLYDNVNLKIQNMIIPNKILNKTITI